MARMIPPIPKDFHGSKGEERVFRALRTLPDEVIVIHSFRWVHPGNARALSREIGAQGEGDFVLIDPARGILVVEVKGGEVWCEDGEWYQRNRRTGQAQAIDPESQASNTMHRIRTEVTERWSMAKGILFCHAVWFPDGAIAHDNLPMNYHPSMTLDSEDIARPDAAIQRVFAYWRTLHKNRMGPGSHTQAILKILAPSFSIVASVRQTIDEREETMVQLNREQAKVLDFLDEQFHTAIHGAAGTGKTLLAIEKARRLATPTEPVLFLCFNVALKDHLRTRHANPNVSYHTFHGFAREIVGPTGSLDEAVQELLEHLMDDRRIPYKHVVVDEAQDFDREWLELLRCSFRNGAFYVFYDRYQAIQGQKDTSWIDEIPCRLVLSRNCRNTDPIAKVAYRAGGLNLSPALGVEGPHPVLHTVADTAAAVKLADMLISAACKEHCEPAHEVAVISLERLEEGGPWSRSTIGGRPVSESPQLNHVTITTVRRFKGLEASLVIVVDVDFARATDALWRLLLYVACSRARHAVHVITTTPESALKDAICSLSGTEKARPSWRALCRVLGLRLGGETCDPFK